MKTETIEIIGDIGNKTTIAGGGIAGAGWLTASEFAAIVGAIVAVAGLMITWYYKREANRRWAAEHVLRQEAMLIRVARMRQGLEVPDDSELGDQEDET